MRPGWHIRQAVAADAQALKHCMDSAYAEYQSRMDGERLPPMEVDYRTEIRDFPVWVVERDENILGGLIMSFADGHAAIANIAVNPDYQGQGVGGGLMRFAEAQAINAGLSELRLATHALLTENLSLYRHLGWVETGRSGNKIYLSKKL